MNRQRSCTLKSVKTGEEFHFDQMKDADLFLGRVSGYVRQCVLKGWHIWNEDRSDNFIITVDESDYNYAGAKPVQLCCYCKNFAVGCPWSERFEPVKGWTATPTKISRNGEMADSYLITACPLYVKG